MLRPGMRTSSIFNSQHVATRHNKVAKRTQHVAMLRPTCCDALRSNVAIVWPELSNAGRTMLGEQCWDTVNLRISAPPPPRISAPSNNRPSYQPKFKIRSASPRISAPSPPLLPPILWKSNETFKDV